MNEFLAIGIVGAALSLLVEWLQAKYGTSSKETRAIVLGGAIMLGAAVWALSLNTVLYEAVLGVLASASTVYAMFFSDKHRNADGK